MTDEASETFGGALKNWLGALGFILPLVGVEEAIRHFVDSQHPSLPLWASGTLIVAGLLIYASPAGWRRLKGLTARISQAGASATPTSQGALVSGATLRLLMRPNQDPQELSRDNIWRWFVFSLAAQDQQTGTRAPLATFLFLTFDRPTQTMYRRVFSPSNPTLRFEILDLTERSMVIGLPNADATGAAVEVQVSGSPL